ncbi:hypothetical protein PIB30_057954 [Stylosanthes scabra]|uniref:Uncharacterized protein n=1 Tax=Stylosanthes scabra TaxID=79078 RepID=A0ABU6ZIK2_9FABA|nr:hypothetical protein [Stylosanthes scabra]
MLAEVQIRGRQDEPGLGALYGLATEMATRGRGRNTASTRTGSRSNTMEILAAINTMAAAMHDSATATN